MLQRVSKLSRDNIESHWPTVVFTTACLLALLIVSARTGSDISIKVAGAGFSTRHEIAPRNSGAATFEPVFNAMMTDSRNVSLAPEQSTAILGWLDVATCARFTGWTGDTGNPNMPIAVHFYDGPAGGGGILFATTTADRSREPEVCQELGGSNCASCGSDPNQPQCKHGFIFLNIPPPLWDENIHQIFAYGVNPTTGGNAQLLGTPKTILCSPTPPSFESIWSSVADNTSRVAWGDYDGDGDLDLVVGHTDENSPNQIFRNDHDHLTLVWESSEAARTSSVAWGDYDGDGDLDLAVGNADQSVAEWSQNWLYRNDGIDSSGRPKFIQVWNSPEAELTLSIAWGDYDNDGDLDLVAGNGGVGTIEILGREFVIPTVGSNRLYRNDGVAENGQPIFNSVWTSGEKHFTVSVAWGDYNGDGYLDLAAGNADVKVISVFPSLEISKGESNQVYRNEAGHLSPTPTWSSTEKDLTASVAWGDYDGDGDLDLAVGNFDMDVDFNIDTGITVHPRGYPNRLYRNDHGTLTANAVWSSTERDMTTSVDWGDYDNDGDLDLIVGNATQESDSGSPIPDSGRNRLYRNLGHALAQSAAWVSAESDDTLNLVWGDYDGDGTLDLFSGNGNFDAGQPNRLYHNQSVALLPNPSWSSGSSDWIWALAWGDIDGDGDLDLAVGNGGRDGSQPNKLFRNEAGVLRVDPAAWHTNQPTPTSSLAWGDYDGDGDLDLAVGNYDSPSQLYRNNLGVLALDPRWANTEASNTLALAWVDYDGDADLDLAAGNFSDTLHLYMNEDGVLSATPSWQSSGNNFTWSIAWGDYDGDGDPDLAVGNNKEPNQVYRNDGIAQNGSPLLNLVWSSQEVNETRSVAWGDYDGDGDPDLAVGNNGEPNLVYRNDDGAFKVAWVSQESEDTSSIMWGDYDTDGDLDLVVGNKGRPARIYRNDHGVLTQSASWSSSDSDQAYDVAWADYDGDGDLDLAVGINAGPVWLYQNPRRVNSPANDPPYLVIQPVEPASAAIPSASARIIKSNYIPITYTLYDAEGDPVPKIIPEFSPNGGEQWFPATAGPGGDGFTHLTSSPGGVRHTFVWNAGSDLLRSDNIVFRIRAQPNNTHSPILWSAQGAQSFPFRVEATEWYAKVVDEQGQAIEGTRLYYAGQSVTNSDGTPRLTNRAGLLRLDHPVPGQPLVALFRASEQTTLRAGHDGWAYRTYVTNLSIDPSGVPQPQTVGALGRQLLTLRKGNPLIVFNIVASVEWDADTQYLNMLSAAFRNASDYLYDVTDGQMAFGQVAIYDNAQLWSHADFQFSTKNTVRPYSFIGGVTSNDTAHTIRLGRFWNGNSGDQGGWDQPNGYRTLVHEFGHYALYLQDEYFVRTVDVHGNFTGERHADCTGPSVGPPKKDQPDPFPEQPDNASIMYYQYKASELADGRRWNTNCQGTEQHRVNGGSDWQTVLAHYGGSNWTLNTPDRRGNIMAGPQSFPRHLLPFPMTSVYNSGTSGTAKRDLTVVDLSGHFVPNALVALYTTPYSYTVAIDQGQTDQYGRIAIYGAAVGDRIQVASFDGALAGALTVDSRTVYTLTLQPTQASTSATQSVSASPYLDLIPGSEGDTLNLEVHGLSADRSSLIAFVIPGEGGGGPRSTPLAYSVTKSAYAGEVGFAGVGLGSGAVQVTGVAGGTLVSINSNYNLLRVLNAQTNDLVSEDGNLQLHLNPGSLPYHADAFAAIYSVGYLPGPIPAERQLLGNVYQIRFSGAVTNLTKPGVVRMHYHPSLMPATNDLAIYHWEADDKRWRRIGGEHSELDNVVTTTIDRLGIYALLGTPYTVYLPVVLR